MFIQRMLSFFCLCIALSFSAEKPQAHGGLLPDIRSILPLPRPLILGEGSAFSIPSNKLDEEDDDRDLLYERATVKEYCFEQVCIQQEPHIPGLDSRTEAVDFHYMKSNTYGGDDPLFTFLCMLFPEKNRDQLWRIYQQLTAKMRLQLMQAWILWAESFKEYLVLGTQLPAGGGEPPEVYRSSVRTVPPATLRLLERLIREKNREAWLKDKMKGIKPRGDSHPAPPLYDSDVPGKGKRRRERGRESHPVFHEAPKASRPPELFHLVDIASGAPAYEGSRNQICSRQMQTKLSKLGLTILLTPADDNCLFHSIAGQLPAYNYDMSKGALLRTALANDIRRLKDSGHTLFSYLGSNNADFLEGQDSFDSILHFLERTTDSDKWAGFEHITLLARMYQFYSLVTQSHYFNGRYDLSLFLITPSGSYHKLKNKDFRKVLEGVSPQFRIFDDSLISLPEVFTKEDEARNGPAPIVFVSFENRMEEGLRPLSAELRQLMEVDSLIENTPPHWSALALPGEPAFLNRRYSPAAVMAELQHIQTSPPVSQAATALYSEPEHESGLEQRQRPELVPDLLPNSEKPRQRPKKKKKTKQPEIASTAVATSEPFAETPPVIPEHTEPAQSLGEANLQTNNALPDLITMTESHPVIEASALPEPSTLDFMAVQVSVPEQELEPEPEFDPEPDLLPTEHLPTDSPSLLPTQETKNTRHKQRLLLAAPKRMKSNQKEPPGESGHKFLQSMDSELVRLLSSELPQEKADSNPVKAGKKVHRVREWRKGLELLVRGLQQINASVKHLGELATIYLPRQVLNDDYQAAWQRFFQAATEYDLPYAWTLLAMLDEWSPAQLPDKPFRLTAAAIGAVHGNRQAMTLLSIQQLYQPGYDFPQVQLLSLLLHWYRNKDFQTHLFFQLEPDHEYSQLLENTPLTEMNELINTRFGVQLLPEELMGSFAQAASESTLPLLQLVDQPEQLLSRIVDSKHHSTEFYHYQVVTRWLVQASKAEQKPGGKGKSKKKGKGKAPEKKAKAKPKKMTGSLELWMTSDACLASAQPLRECRHLHQNGGNLQGKLWHRLLQVLDARVSLLQQASDAEPQQMQLDDDVRLLSVGQDDIEEFQYLNYLLHWLLPAPPEPAVLSKTVDISGQSLENGAEPDPDPDPEQSQENEARAAPQTDQMPFIPHHRVPNAWLADLDSRIPDHLSKACPVQDWLPPSGSCCQGLPESYCHFMAGLTLLKAKPDKTTIIQLQGLEQTLNDDELETARDHFQQARMGGIPYAATLIAILGEVSTEPSEHPGHRHMRMLPLLFDEALLGVSDGVAQLLPLFLKEHHPLGFNNPGLTGALLKLNYYLPLNFVLEFRRPDSHYGPFTAGWLPSGALTWLVQQLMPQQDPKRESEASFNEILRQAKRKDSNAADEMLLTMDLLATQFNRMDLRYAAKLPGQVRLLQAINYPRFSNVPPIGPWITRKLLSQLAKPTSKLSTYLDWLGSFSYSMPDSAVPDVSNFQSWEPSGLAEIILPTSDPLSYCIDLQGQLQEQYGTQMPGLEIWIGRVVILHWYIDHLWRQRVIRDDSIDPPPPELFDLNSKLKTVIKQPGLREGLLSHMEFLLERDREAGIEPVIRTESNLKAKAADRQGSMPEPVPPQGTLEEIPDDPGFMPRQQNLWVISGSGSLPSV